MPLAFAAIAMFNSDNPLGARVGSVVNIRFGDRTGSLPIGNMERKLYVYVPIENMTDPDLEDLNNREYFNEGNLIITRMFPYFISELSMRGRLPLFDLLRGMNKNETYQPFMDLRNGSIDYFVSRTALSDINTIQRRRDNSFYIGKDRG